MIRCELTQAMAAKAGLTNMQAEAALDAFGTTVTEVLVTDKKIQFPGVFTASTTQRAKREGHNPATDETMVIPTRRVVKFAPANALKNAL